MEENSEGNKCKDCMFKLVENASPTLFKLGIEQADYVLNYEKYDKELSDLVAHLICETQTLQHKIDDARNNVKGVNEIVDRWLQKVESKIKEVEEFQKDEHHEKTGCCQELILFLWHRYQIGKKAKELSADVESLKKDVPRDRVDHEQNLTYIKDNFHNDGYEEFASRKDTMEKIMAKLKDPSVRMIGVHGSGGVGKSTLVNEIAEEAGRKKLFTVVVKVDVTANPNLQNIQEDIAYVLRLRFDGEGEIGRAHRLRERLKKEKALIILDDLWDRLDLNKLGIPFHDDLRQPKDSDYKGCKLLLTSRKKEVLSKKMDLKEDAIYPLVELEEEDALTLFKKVVGKPDEISKSIQDIVKRCGGLPVAIVILAKGLRDKDESMWVDELKRKPLMEVHKSMEFSVKMNYDHLESQELKSIFLLCAQMGHQPLIMDLVKYCFGLGIPEGVDSLKEAREEIYASIQKLKNSSLLLGAGSEDHFKMHDMVRDAALSIARKEQHVFTLRNGKLNDWPDEDQLGRFTTISIHNSVIEDELPQVMNCPQLKVFHIDNNDPSLKIPDRFFRRMKKLKVLMLSGFHLEGLPSSIQCLSNLRMLCLERCNLTGDLSIIGKLKKLRILSFFQSKIENSPANHESWCLSKLHLLDITDCSIRMVIPRNFISSLTRLEELYARNSFISKGVEGETNQSLITFLEELRHLHELKIIDLSIPSAAVLPKSLFFNKLNDYKIAIGNFNRQSVGDFKMPDKYEASRSLALQLEDDIDIRSLEGVKMLFRRVENLLLGEQKVVQNAFDELSLDRLPDLKHLTIINNPDIEYIINSMELWHAHDAFPCLDSLWLDRLSNIKEICCKQITGSSFNKLKTITVMTCIRLKNLFSFQMVTFLESLETIEVYECNHLEEIVVMDQEQINNQKLKFDKLRSLTLSWLPSFTSFYTNGKMPSSPELTEGQATNTDEITNANDEHIVTAPPSIFSELVEIPHLESLELSLVKVHNIWSDQPSSCCFENLIELVVTNCHYLRYLCSLSVASCLKKLKGLFVSECQKMKKIFNVEDNKDYSKEEIFPNLEEMRLWDMDMLTDVWPDVKVGENSFSSLVSFNVSVCHKLKKIFSRHTVGWFESIDSVKVCYCDSVEVIFEIQNSISPHRKKDPPQEDTSGIDTKLRLIHLGDLKSLNHVWDKDPSGILNFKNLQILHIAFCLKLRNVLPASVARSLKKLEKFHVKFCDKMQEIVVTEPGSETSNEPLVFPEVTSMEFRSLPRIDRFCMGRNPIECPELKRLEVNECKHLKIFTSETTSEEGKPVFLAEKVITSLESLKIDLKEATWLQSSIGKYQMHSLKELCLSHLSSIELLYWFLHRIPNLEKLSLEDSSLVELVPDGNIVPQQRLPIVFQLKELTLYFTYIKDIGFQLEPALQRLERLVLQQCHNLIILAHSSVSLSHLTYLEVDGCRRLINLMASSMAKCLVELTTFRVINCKAIKKIITIVGNEEDKVVRIEFRKLITLELVELKNLTNFCSYRNCEFEFPSLEKLIVQNCPRMKTFTESHLRAPKLQNILGFEGEKEGQWNWQGDLNATIRKAFTDERLVLSDHPELEQAWLGKELVQENRFHNLKTLIVRNYEYLVYAIPSHLLACFKNLEELRVESCSAVQVIFDISDDTLRAAKALGIFRLKKLMLSYLPKLEHVWSKDPEGILGLQVPPYMEVEECDSLKYLFPASAAKYHARLENLTVTNCENLVEIFGKDENEIATESATKEFVFHCLTSLTIRDLPEIKYFHLGLRKLEWPVLKELDVDRCGLVVFMCQETYPEDQLPNPIEKIPCLGKLSFCMGASRAIWYPESKSKKLILKELERFQEEPDSDLYGFLEMVPKIEKLEVQWGSFEEMFSAEKRNANYTGVFSHLQEVKLNHNNLLKSIGLEHSWLHPIPENLQTLELKWCDGLTNLVPGTVSFSNLTSLAISRCMSMQYLLTSSTAKSLVRLKSMEIISCKSMREIVSEEGDESRQDEEIRFEQLQSLYLEDLPMLTCFYPGNLTLRFPSLQTVSIFECYWMKTFCSVSCVNSTMSSSGVRFKDDLNTTMHAAFLEQIEEIAHDSQLLKLSDNPQLQVIWNGEVPVPDMSFKNLKSLIVDGCDFLPDVLLPSHLLPYLTKLESLEVRNCSSVKTIFEHLPNLENVWNEGPDFTFPCLTSLTLLSLPNLKDFHRSPHIEHQVCIEEVTPNLQCLSIGQEELKIVWHGQFKGSLLHKMKDLVLDGFNIESYELSFGFLRKVPNIEKLVVQSSSFKEIFCSQIPNTDDAGFLSSQLKGLELSSNSELISIGLEHPWVDPFVRNLETLEVTWCSCLRNLVPSVVCFSNLMDLIVMDCVELIYLFTSSTAKSLTRLKQMGIIRCKSLQEIVFTEGDESHHGEIMFGQLQMLCLVYLPDLRSFCKGRFTLCFPSLEQLSVIDCGRMKTFCSGILNATKLSDVQFTLGEYDPLEVDLNSTIRKKFQETVVKSACEVQNDLKLGDDMDLLEIWHWQGSYPIPISCFHKLKSLTVEGCQSLSYVIPFHVLCLLSLLENLVVQKCHSAKAIFEVKGKAKDTSNSSTVPVFSLSLKKLTLEQLPNLKHVWDSDPQEIISFENLEEVSVQTCDGLEGVFPASVAKCLVKLMKLEIQQCKGLVEIVAVDEGAVEEAPIEFGLDCMTSITLSLLPKLKCFYSGPHKLECPNLTHIQLFHCDKLKTFTCESQSFPEEQAESQVSIPHDKQALFSEDKVIPYLRTVALNKEETMMISQGKFRASLDNVQNLWLQCFHDDTDIFPHGLLEKVPNIQNLVVYCSSFKEIFCSERPSVDCPEEILSHLKSLQLNSLSVLNSIGLEHPWLIFVSEKLETLQILKCHCLRNIAPSTASFSHLTDLDVSQCHGLVYLFTSSTARSLGQLKSMSVKDCESLQEIMFEDAEKSSSHEEEEIIFDHLETLSLSSLPRLGRFYSGSCALSLPSLQHLSLIQCCRMETFCAGTITVNKLSKVEFKENADTVPLEVDLNSAIRNAFEAPGTSN